MRVHRTDLIAIGDLAARTGVAVSAIRFYEAKGLVEALRTRGGQRRFLRADIRRISFILIAQQLGLSLEEIAAELARLPAGRTPNGADWTRISTGLRIADRCADRRARTHARTARQLHRLRLSQPQEMRAL
jgi:MerR family redox-sensitive transcriptional activator SoxR